MLLEIMWCLDQARQHGIHLPANQGTKLHDCGLVTERLLDPSGLFFVASVVMLVRGQVFAAEP